MRARFYYSHDCLFPNEQNEIDELTRHLKTGVTNIVE